jgi:hypothetical protein
MHAKSYEFGQACSQNLEIL